MFFCLKYTHTQFVITNFQLIYYENTTKILSRN